MIIGRLPSGKAIIFGDEESAKSSGYEYSVFSDDQFPNTLKVGQSVHVSIKEHNIFVVDEYSVNSPTPEEKLRADVDFLAVMMGVEL